MNKTALKKNLENLENLDALEDIIGIKFKDKSLLIRALTHKSACGDESYNYERLEFLGDRVLELITLNSLKCTKANASKFTTNKTLAIAGKKLKLENWIIIGLYKRINNKDIADIMEAIIGAIELDNEDPLEREIKIYQFIQNHILTDSRYKKENFKLNSTGIEVFKCAISRYLVKTKKHSVGEMTIIEGLSIHILRKNSQEILKKIKKYIPQSTEKNPIHFIENFLGFIETQNIHDPEKKEKLIDQIIQKFLIENIDFKEILKTTKKKNKQKQKTLSLKREKRKPCKLESINLLKLQEISLQETNSIPIYKNLQKKDNLFSITLEILRINNRVPEYISEIGIGLTQKEAQEDAAKKLLEKIKPI